MVLSKRFSIILIGECFFCFRLLLVISKLFQLLRMRLWRSFCIWQRHIKVALIRKTLTTSAAEFDLGYLFIVCLALVFWKKYVSKTWLYICNLTYSTALTQFAYFNRQIVLLPWKELSYKFTTRSSIFYIIASQIYGHICTYYLPR